MAVADGSVYVTTLDLPIVATTLGTVDGDKAGGLPTGEVEALSLATGKVEWDVRVPTLPLGAATVSQDLVFTTLYTGELLALNRDYGTSIILISHDLGVISRVCSRIIVMYAGEAVEEGPTESVLTDPKHPYSWGLLQSLVRLEDARDTPLQPIAGAPPSLIDLPPGCPFRPRCAHAIERCATEAPMLRALGNGHRVACHVAAAP